MEKERVENVKGLEDSMIEKRLEVVAGLSKDSVFEYTIATDCMRYYNRKEILIDFLRNCPVVENYTERILDGSILEELFHREDKQKLQQLCMDFRSGKPEIYTEIRKQYEPGKYTWVSVEAKTVVDKQGKPSHVIGKISNVDEKIKREQEVKSRLERDSLTGLYNRHTVEQKITEVLAKGVPKDSYVILTDVDDFKNINDTMGHLFGDGLLCTFANALTEVFSEGIIGRIDGDEFIIYLEGLKAEDIQHQISGINRRLARIHAGDNDELEISASFGIVKCEHGKDNALEWLKEKADIALCFIKQSSKCAAAIYKKSMEARHIHRVEKKEKAL